MQTTSSKYISVSKFNWKIYAVEKFVLEMQKVFAVGCNSNI